MSDPSSPSPRNNYSFPWVWIWPLPALAGNLMMLVFSRKIWIPALIRIHRDPVMAVPGYVILFVSLMLGGLYYHSILDSKSFLGENSWELLPSPKKKLDIRLLIYRFMLLFGLYCYLIYGLRFFC